MDTDDFRRGCVQRALKEGISISTLKLSSGTAYVVHSNSGKDYVLKKEGKSYICFDKATGELCPSYEHRGYCKHLGRLDTYFLNHGVNEVAVAPVTDITVVAGDVEISGRA